MKRGVRLSTADAGVSGGAARASTLRLVIAGRVGGAEVGTTCTASRVAEGVAITARHCFSSFDSWRISIGAADEEGARGDDDACLHFVEANVVSHPRLDLALVFFPDPTPHASVPVATNLPDGNAPLLLAGYGTTEAGTHGDFRALPATIVVRHSEAVTVQGHGGGACIGDSGGPLFAVGEDRAMTLLGTLSNGSASCLGQDSYILAAAARDWLDQSTPLIQWVAR